MTRTTRTTVTARLLAVGAVVAAAVTLAGPASQASAATAAGTGTTSVSSTAVPSAMAIVERMAEHKGVYLMEPRDEGPDTVVVGGFCTRIEELGCVQMVATKDASVMVFDTVKNASFYEGGADDRSKALGRMVVSFGSPERVRPALQDDYVRAVRAFRAKHPEVRNDAARAVRYVANHGLLMRDAHFEDARGKRLGLASEIPGAVDMAATNQADVIVFDDRESAEEYVANADDVTYRYRRVVLSFGNPPRVVEESQGTYRRALRSVLGG